MLFFVVFRQLLKSKEWVLSVFPCGKCYGHQRGIVLCSVIGAELSADLDLCLYRTYGSFTGIIVVGYGVMGQEHAGKDRHIQFLLINQITKTTYNNKGQPAKIVVVLCCLMLFELMTNGQNGQALPECVLGRISFFCSFEPPR